jgi:hypothetical protein
MTTTRKYYESLINSFSELNLIKPNQVSHFLECKENLNSLIQRITKFNLFPLTFSTAFNSALNKTTIENLIEEKLLLSVELNFELHECLNTSRLRFGGELLQYLNKLEAALLNLSIQELEQFNKRRKTLGHFSYTGEQAIKTEEDKKKRIKDCLKKAKQKKFNRQRNVLTKGDYLNIETNLQKDISQYKSYIYENYPSISDAFSFYNKKIRAYISEAMSKDIYEFRIHSYTPSNGDTSLKLESQLYDFYPAYFFNMEEIIDRQVSAIVFGLNKKELSFKNYFDKKNIHQQLIEIFIGNAKEESIVDFTSFLLKCDGFNIIQNTDQIYQFDISAAKDSQIHFFEIFHLQPRNIKIISEKINTLKQITKKHIIHFVFSSYPGVETEQLLSQNGVNSIYLTNMTRGYFALDNSEILHWYIKSKLPEIVLSKNAELKSFEGKNIIERLEKCPLGEKGWVNYEKIGIDIFKFLFEDGFKKYLAEEQVGNDLKNHRRDLLVSNNSLDSSSFWADMKSRYKSTAIIVDFKNYGKQLNSTTLFSVSKYNTKNVGDFAIVFSRMGIDNTAKNEQKALFESGKLLIVFSDEELKEMIREKMIGKDPTDRLESKKFELVKRS